MNFQPQKPIDEFNRCRGHQIEHKNYIDDLKAGNWNNEKSSQNSEKSSQNPSESKVGRSISLTVPQDSVEKPPSSGGRRFSTLNITRLEPVDLETTPPKSPMKIGEPPKFTTPPKSPLKVGSPPKFKQPSVSPIPPRAVRSKSTVEDVERFQAEKKSGSVSRSGSGAGTSSKQPSGSPRVDRSKSTVEALESSRKSSSSKNRLQVPTQRSYEEDTIPRKSSGTKVKLSLSKQNSTEKSPKESPSGSNSGSKNKLDSSKKSSSLDEKEKSSKVERSKSSVGQTTKTQTQTSLPLGDSKNEKKYTTRKKTAPI